MKTALIIGGANGIGLAVELSFANLCKKVIIVDRKSPQIELPENIDVKEVTLLTTNFKWLNDFDEVDVLFYSAGFGRVAPFESLKQKEI